MIQILNSTPETLHSSGLFCIKDPKKPGYKKKTDWFSARYKEGLRLKTAVTDTGKTIGFIEYVPAEMAWRPVKAPGYMFIHCLMISGRSEKQKGYGSQLIEACIADAQQQQKYGITVMTSKGSWITDKRIFEKHGFHQSDQRGRFELMTKTFASGPALPRLIDWTQIQSKYQGWHLLYADQCPWHNKAVHELSQVAQSAGISLQITQLNSPAQAQAAPSGFGVFSLLFNGRLLADHYISATRFKNILAKIPE